MAPMKGRQVHMSLYLTPEKFDQLQALSRRTRIAMAEHLREAVDDLLKKYEAPAKSSKSKRAPAE